MNMCRIQWANVLNVYECWTVAILTNVINYINASKCWAQQHQRKRIIIQHKMFCDFHELIWQNLYVFYFQHAKCVWVCILYDKTFSFTKQYLYAWLLYQQCAFVSKCVYVYASCNCFEYFQFRLATVFFNLILNILWDPFWCVRLDIIIGMI
jgi:hypothetical protein